MNPYKKENMRAFIESIPPEMVAENQRQQHEDNERVFQQFQESLKTGICFLCGGKMDSFDDKAPCFHWFLYPQGIRKKNFETYLKQPIGFFQLDSYFRWFANSDRPIGNINDLKDEISKTSYLETTYRYKNLEWAFSVGYSDKEGHNNTIAGAIPHYHIQMKVNGRIFLKFNDFHIPFSDADLLMMEMFEQAPDLVGWGHHHGQGIGILEDEDNLEFIDRVMTTTDNFDNGIFRRQTFFSAKPGHTIPGELLGKAIEENSRTKEPIGRILQRLLAETEIEVSFISTISPGPAVTKMARRSGKNKE